MRAIDVDLTQRETDFVDALVRSAHEVFQTALHLVEREEALRNAK